MSRMRWSAAGIVVACVVAAAPPLSADSYPDRPVKVVVASAAGGPSDVPARMSADFIAKLGQPGVVENRPGAGGLVGTRSVASSPADGYTLLIGNTSVLAVNPSVSASAGYDPIKSFVPVAKFSEGVLVLVVDPALPVTNVKELIDYAKANPGKLNYSHSGYGALPHLTAELFLSRTGTKAVGVPFRSGAEGVSAILGKQIQLTFESTSILMPLIRDGKLRALAITGRTRTPLAPDLPTLIEAGVPDFEVTTFNGIVAPAGTPAPVVARLNAAINDGLKTREAQETLAKLGVVPTPQTPEQFGAFIAAEMAKWKGVAQAANIKVD